MPLPTTGNTPHPRAHGYHVQIEDNFWQVVSAPDRPFDLVAQAGRIPTAREFISSPEDIPRSEHTAEFGQTDFSGGEGLDFAHRPDNTDFDATRFWASRAVNVIEGHGDVQKFELEKAVSKIYDQSNFTTRDTQSPQMVEAGGSLFVIGNAGDSSLITRIDNPAGTPSTAIEDPHGSTPSILTIAEVDEAVFVTVDGDGIYKRAVGGGWTRIAAATPARMWGLKGRLVATNTGGDDVREIATDGTLSPFVMLSNVQVRCATDAGAAILVGADDGYVYAFADVDGSLTLRAQTRFQSEKISAIGAGPSGIVLVATRQGDRGRLYMGELGSSYTIQNSQLLREWDMSSTAGQASSISHITFTRDSAYFGFRDPNLTLQLWRFDVVTTGLFHLWTASVTDDVGVAGIEVEAGKLFLATDRHDVYGQQDTYQTSSWLISPLFDHFSAEDKVWAAAKLFGVNLPANTQAKLFYSTDPDALENNAHASWTLVKTLTNASGVDDTEVVLVNAKSRWITLKVELTTTDAAVTPQMRGFSVRSYAGEGDWEVTVPLNVSDVVVRPGRKPTKVPGLGDLRYDTLKTYEGGAVTLTWLYPGETFEGTVEQVGLRSPLQPRRGGNLMVAEVKFVGRRT